MRLIERRGYLWEELRISDDPEVQEFLRACAAGGASLSQLTPPVIDWIAGRNLTGRFKIVPA